LGLVLCLVLNINAFSIWSTLYTDQVVRGKLIEPSKVEALLNAPQEPGAKGSPSAANQDKALAELRENFLAQVKNLKTDLSFGVGRIWSPELRKSEVYVKQGPWVAMLLEFFGSLLTGILLSIGAPYWHDLMRRLSALRPMSK
jgi:hypothetical protein